MDGQAAPKKAIAVGKIRVDWVSCLLREQIFPRRCLKYLEFEDISRNCMSKYDRSKLFPFSAHLRPIIEKGHIAKECNAYPKCLLCSEKQESNIVHITGSYKCPAFKKAISAYHK